MYLISTYVIQKCKKAHIIFFPSCGAGAQRGPPHSWGFWITHNDAPQLVGLLWTGDRPVAMASDSTQHLTRDYLCPWLNSNPQSQQADPRLTPRGHWVPRTNKYLL